MIDGTYDVEARTPLGAKAGRLVLTCDGAACNAELTVAGKCAHLVGTVDGELVSFEGTIKLPFPLGTQAYELVGSVQGNTLRGVCTTKKFKFDVVGTRVA